MQHHGSYRTIDTTTHSYQDFTVLTQFYKGLVYSAKVVYFGEKWKAKISKNGQA